MFSKQIKKSRNFLQSFISSSSQNPVFPFLHNPQPAYSYTQIQSYVDVYMKWKKDSYYDSIDSIHKSLQLKPIISLKNFFISSSSSSSSSSSPHDNYSIPISAVSKKGSDFDIHIKVARFLRNYPSFFEEFEGPKYNLPWFRLTHKAIELDKEEKMLYAKFKADILERLKKFILMSGSKKLLPLKVINSLQWYLGLPEEFSRDPLEFLGDYECFKIIEMEDGLKGLAVTDSNSNGNNGNFLSVLQKNKMRRCLYNGGSNESIAFPLFPSKGLRLKQKIKDWLVEFQKLPYISPYDDFSGLRPDSDLSEKRVVALLHELLCLFVEHSVERKKLLCLKKYLGLPQKVHKAFERHPHIFYLSLKNKTCTAILKEAYQDKSTIEPHPLANVRNKYIALMNESDFILKNRRVNNSRPFDRANVYVKDLDCSDDEGPEMAEASH